jgi:hypothetical protein
MTWHYITVHCAWCLGWAGLTVGESVRSKSRESESERAPPSMACPAAEAMLEILDLLTFSFFLAPDSPRLRTSSLVCFFFVGPLFSGGHHVVA